MSVSIIIPAFNEETRLPVTLGATADYFLSRNEPFEILVVDDGSADGTASVIDHYSETHPRSCVRRLGYGANRGKGYAVRFGMLQGTGELRLFCDADLATPVEEYAVVLADMVRRKARIGIGSRPLKESNLTVHQPWYREMLGRGFNKLVQTLAVPGIQDTQCGFKIFTAGATEEVFSRCQLDGFAFDCEVLYVASRLGFTIAETPIRWAHKDGSKVSMARDGVRMIRDLTRIRRMHRGLTPLSGNVLSSLPLPLEHA